MRNLNFLRKSERKSVGTTLALTVGSPSAHRRYSALKHLAFMLLFLLGSLNVWGADYVKVTSASDLVEGQVYVIAEISDNTTKYLVTGTGQKLVNTTSGFTVSNNTITTSTATPLEFTLGTVTSGNNTYYTLKCSSTNYLGYNSSTNFRTNQTTTTDTKEQWSITSTNSFDIRNVSTLSATTKRRIARNSANIGPYDASSSTYKPCYLFKKQTSAPTFTIAAQSNDESKGTVSLSGSVITGSPKEGFRYADPAYTVTPANSATVSQNGNAFTVTPSANTTITINFEAIPAYTVSFSTGTGNPTQVDVAETLGGQGITLPAGPTPACHEDGWVFAGWSETECSVGGSPTLLPNRTYHPSNNITLYAVYVNPTNTYNKITSTSDLKSGNYLVVCDVKGYAMKNATLTQDYYIAYQGVTIDENAISLAETSEANKAAIIWRITKTGDNAYNLYNVAIDKYAEIILNGTYKNLLLIENTQSGFSASFTDGAVTLASNNVESSQLIYHNSYDEFCAGTSAGKAVYLYKQDATYNSNPTCCTKHNVNIASLTNGSVEANPTSACEGTEITLTITPETGYELKAPLFIKEGDEVVITTRDGKYFSKG